MRGRLLAFTAVAFLGSTPIGGPVTGVIADRVGAEWSMAYGSIITLAAVAVAAVVLGRRQPVAATDAAATVDAHGRRAPDVPVVGIDTRPTT
jgi:MFS family permease